MSSNESHTSRHASEDGAEVKSDNSKVDNKLQEVGCCGDVPKYMKSNEKRDKLLEWLKNSQLKREENNRQVFSRWIDMVDNGAIDLSNYPGKSTKPNIHPNSNISQMNSINVPVDVSHLGSEINAIKAPIKTPINNSQYYSNYYGNWFVGNQNQTLYSPFQVPQPNGLGMYQGFGPYCNNGQVLGNYYQYVPMPQTCNLCPQYVVPAYTNSVDPNYVPSNLISPVPTNENSPVNIEVNKWFDILNEIKINNSDKSSDKNLLNDNNTASSENQENVES